MAENKKELVIRAVRGEYKGFPLLILTSGTNERYPFQFGLQKAQRIVATFDDIKKFVEEEEAKLRDKAASPTAEATAVSTETI